MSAAPTSTATPAERIAGKWQIPAFLAAGLALAVVALQVTSPDRKLSIDEHLVQLREFNTLGLFNTAIERCERLLAWDDLTETEHGAIGLQLARAEFGRWAAEGDPEPEAAKLVIGRYALAQGQGAELAAIDERNRARAFEHLHKYELAVKHYQRAVEKGGPPALADRRRIIELSEYPLRVETAQLGQLIDEFIELAVNDPQQLLWGLTLKIEHAASAGAEPVGDALLAGYREHFRGTLSRRNIRFCGRWRCVIRGATTRRSVCCAICSTASRLPIRYIPRRAGSWAGWSCMTGGPSDRKRRCPSSRT
jgi:tetratricopeptide (TPR) repeat protein